MSDNIFESIKKINKDGYEFWFAREFAKVLGYSDFGNFENVIEKAKIACDMAGQYSQEHFGEVGEMIEIANGGQREFPSYKLSRYACYLIAQNGDPRKVAIAKAQTYFAIKTRQKEIDDIFNKDSILDHMNSEELAANLFRATQADAKIKRENIQGQMNASLAHKQVGEKVRNTIKSLGGTMPEDLPVVESIKVAKKRIKESKKKYL